MGEKLTCDEARSIDLVQYLESLGHYPQRIIRSDYWYLSPLRQERNASFKVDRKLNLWYDHGIGKGGTLIDFGILYFNCSIGELLNKLSQNAPSSLTFHPTFTAPLPKYGQMEEKIRIVYVGDLQSDELKQYLGKRKIDENLAGQYCREIHFTLYGKAHVAIGFPNNSGGYELRNAYFKGSSAPKDITLIDRNRYTITVLEGFFSFLSFLQLYRKKEQVETSFLVLNSLALLGKALPVLESYRKVHLYLDQDTAGRKATEKALALLPCCRDRSCRYRNHKDLNELLVYGRQGKN
jgi:hypothetical protein